MHGTIARVSPERGFGYITPDEEGGEIVFHRDALHGVELQELAPGVAVEFTLGHEDGGQPSEGLRAVEVRLAEDTAPRWRSMRGSRLSDDTPRRHVRSDPLRRRGMCESRRASLEREIDREQSGHVADGVEPPLIVEPSPTSVRFVVIQARPNVKRQDLTGRSIFWVYRVLQEQLDVWAESRNDLGGSTPEHRHNIGVLCDEPIDIRWVLDLEEGVPIRR